PVERREGDEPLERRLLDHQARLLQYFACQALLGGLPPLELAAEAVVLTCLLGVVGAAAQHEGAVAIPDVGERAQLDAHLSAFARRCVAQASPCAPVPWPSSAVRGAGERRSTRPPSRPAA